MPFVSPIHSLCKDVAQEITDGEWSEDLTAEVRLIVPELANQFEGYRVSVVPSERTDELQSRALFESYGQVDVGIQARATTDEEAWKVINLAEEIVAYFRGETLETADGILASNFEARHRLIYDPESLDTKRVVTSIASLNFRFDLDR
ncbi:MAG: hypothetical protein AAF958_00820 [Planctomycetota bacterium]